MATKRRAGSGSYSNLLQYSNGVEAVFSNVDLLHEILARVPAMSLIRFKRVSKKWLSIISDPRFVFLHAELNFRLSSVSGLYISRRYPKELRVLSLCSHTTTPSLAFLKEYSDGLFVEDSCNGLLLCRYLGNPSYLVCNPTTRKYTLLPDSNIEPSYFESAVLAFDPLKPPHYKVVLVSWYRDPYSFTIYSSDSQSWKQIKKACAPMQIGRRDTCPCPLVYWEGAIHWMMSDNQDDNSHCRFDLNAEKLEIIPLPREPKIYNGHKVRYFGVCNGRLIRIQNYKLCSMGFKILEMGKGDSAWTVKRQIRLQSAFPESHYGSIRGSFSVVHVLAGEREDDLKLVLAFGGKLYSYNIKSKILYSFNISELSEYSYRNSEQERNIRGYKFVESLAPL